MKRLSIVFSMLVVAGCASNQNASAPATTSPSPNVNAAPTSATQSPSAKKAPVSSAPTPGVKTVTSVDGTYTGEIIGRIKPGSKFAKVKIGMTMAEVQKLIRVPDDMNRHETGKRWIPFYYGNDSQRIQTYYSGEGCLTYTGGNVFGSGENQLIRIWVDNTRKCFE